jgi:hypothetical protein
MAARVLRLIPGGNSRRRCPNCQVLEQRIEQLESASRNDGEVLVLRKLGVEIRLCRQLAGLGR